MSYSNYNSTMMGTQIDTITVPTITTTNTTSSGSLYWGLNGTSASPGTSTNWDNITLAEPNIKGATLKVKGDADFEGEVTIKGKSLSEMFDKIEERLAILHPNPELEDRWDELKELGKRYKELEQELIEKEKVWAILKK
jgi:hypothetical protein